MGSPYLEVGKGLFFVSKQICYILKSDKFQNRFAVFRSQGRLISCFKAYLLYSEVRKGLFLVLKQICCIQKSGKVYFLFQKRFAV